jgi:TolA protein
MTMRKALAFSVIIHLAVLLLVYFGIPVVQRELVVGSEPVAIDVVNVADSTNLPPPRPAAQPEKPSPAARVDPKPKVDARHETETKSAANARAQPPALLKPEREPETKPETKKVQPPPKAEPPIQAKPQQAAQPKPQQAAKAKAQPAPPQPASVPERNKATAEPQPAPPPKPVPQRDKPAQDRQAPATIAKSEPAAASPEAKPPPAADFQSVLKTVGTLARSDAQKSVAEEVPPKAETKVKPADREAKSADAPEQAFASLIKDALGSGAATPPASGRTYDAAQPVTVSEIDEVRRQIERCWNIPTGARDAGDYAVTIRVEMSPDATPRSATVLNEATTRGDAFHRAAAESALRAVLNPRCHPFKLPIEKYDRWKTMTLVFNPKDMLGT